MRRSWVLAAVVGLALTAGGAQADSATDLAERVARAEAGDPQSQFALGWMYGIGDGVPQDFAEAMRWFRLAADQGYAPAQFSLGWRYQLGVGVPQDNITAHMWFNIASVNGSKLGSENRERISWGMTPADIAVAQRRAKGCLASNYSRCDN